MSDEKVTNNTTSEARITRLEEKNDELEKTVQILKEKIEQIQKCIQILAQPTNTGRQYF